MGVADAVLFAENGAKRLAIPEWDGVANLLGRAVELRAVELRAVELRAVERWDSEMRTALSVGADSAAGCVEMAQSGAHDRTESSGLTASSGRIAPRGLLAPCGGSGWRGGIGLSGRSGRSDREGRERLAVG